MLDLELLEFQKDMASQDSRITELYQLAERLDLRFGQIDLVALVAAEAI